MKSVILVLFVVIVACNAVSIDLTDYSLPEFSDEMETLGNSLKIDEHPVALKDLGICYPGACLRICRGRGYCRYNICRCYWVKVNK